MSKHKTHEKPHHINNKETISSKGLSINYLELKKHGLEQLLEILSKGNNSKVCGLSIRLVDDYITTEMLDKIKLLAETHNELKSLSVSDKYNNKVIIETDSLTKDKILKVMNNSSQFVKRLEEQHKISKLSVLEGRSH